MKTNKYRYIIGFMICITACATVKSQSTDQNYELTKTFLDSLAQRSTDKIDYYNGLGYPAETVQKNVTPNGNDLVEKIGYDNFGRENTKWLPVTNSGNGSYIDNVSSLSAQQYGDNYAYTETTYENSPLNRVINQHNPGADWRTANRSITTAYVMSFFDILMMGYTISGDTIESWGDYNLGIKANKVTDENNHVTYTFKDDLGRLALTRKVYDESINYDTYYVYDYKGDLRYVLPPMAAQSMTGSGIKWTINDDVVKRYAYFYKYDGFHRCIIKKYPGADPIYQVYDKADRLAMTQDGNQRNSSIWTVYKYDIFGRAVVTEDMTVTASFDALRIYFKNNLASVGNTYPAGSNVKQLMKKYYDGYGYFDTYPATTKQKLQYATKSGYGTKYGDAKGKLTGACTYSLSDGRYSLISYYYDDRGRTIQTHETNYMGGAEDEYYSLSFTGKTLKKMHVHTDSISTGNNIQEVYTYTYDNADRLLTTIHQLNNNAPVVLESNAYDELCRLKTQTMNDGNSHVTYTYNIRNWIKGIQSTMFNETLTYEDIASDNYAKEYGGNITSMTWQANGDLQRGYVFGYDSIGRLTNADYQSTRCSEANLDHNVSYAYDMMGNVSKIMRNGTSESTANDWQKMDYVKLTYNGNQLIHATDTVNGPNYPASLSNVPHFHDKNISGNEYMYDNNGNMTEDLNKGITNVTYNLLDLPYLISINGNTIEYDYDAIGMKLREKDITGSVTTRTDYCGNVIYENGTPIKLLTDNGYITLSDSKYHFYYKDHEGNNRVVADQSNTVEQVNNYYPFGLSYKNDANTSANKYKYNGKELQTQNGLDWYDYGARFYDPELCQWHAADRLCEKYSDIGLYVYCENNPLRMVDPTGMYDTEKDARNYAEQIGGAMVLQDTQTGKWFVSMNENGTSAYTTGETVTRYFGPDDETNWESPLSIGLSAWNVGNSAKIDLFNYAVRQNFGYSQNEFKALSNEVKVAKETEALGKSGVRYLNFAKSLGKASIITNAGITIYQANEDYNKGKYISLAMRIAVFGITEGATFVPFVGPALSVSIGLLDAIYGEEFYNYMENTFDK